MNTKLLKLLAEFSPEEMKKLEKCLFEIDMNMNKIQCLMHKKKNTIALKLYYNIDRHYVHMKYFVRSRINKTLNTF